jgi:hypothetical protein
MAAVDSVEGCGDFCGDFAAGLFPNQADRCGFTLESAARCGGFFASLRVASRTENPRVGGSIPSLATHCNNLLQQVLLIRRPPRSGAFSVSRSA